MNIKNNCQRGRCGPRLESLFFIPVFRACPASLLFENQAFTNLALNQISH